MRQKGGPVYRGYRFVGFSEQYPENSIRAIFDALPEFHDHDIEMDEDTFVVVQQYLTFEKPEESHGPDCVGIWKGMRIFLIEQASTWREKK